jgi:hypothetical protein
MAATLDASLAHGRRSGLFTRRISCGPTSGSGPRAKTWTTSPTASWKSRTRIAEAVERGTPPHPSFFEVTTAAAPLAFQRAGIEIAILEVGLGGRPRRDQRRGCRGSVIVGVTDHMATLGSTHGDRRR